MAAIPTSREPAGLWKEPWLWNEKTRVECWLLNLLGCELDQVLGRVMSWKPRAPLVNREPLEYLVPVAVMRFQ